MDVYGNFIAYLTSGHTFRTGRFTLSACCRHVNFSVFFCKATEFFDVDVVVAHFYGIKSDDAHSVAVVVIQITFGHFARCDANICFFFVLKRRESEKNNDDDDDYDLPMTVTMMMIMMM